MKRRNRTVSLVLVVLLMSILAACSSSGKTTSAPGGGTSSAAAQAYVAKAKAFVAAHLKPTQFSAGTPYRPTPGKRIGIVSAGQNNALNAEIVTAAQAAAKAVGWTTVVYDGKGTPSGWNAGIQQFVQQKVDGIFDVAVADDAVPQARAAASAAHIPVANLGAGIRFSKPVADPSFVSIDLPYQLMGQMEGNYLVAASNGKAKVAFFTSQPIPPVLQVAKIAQGILKQCAGCKLVSSVEVGLPQNWTATGATQTQSLLSRFGKGQLEYIAEPLDIMTQGVTEALTAAGRSEVKIVSTGCTPGLTPGLAQIQKGGPTVFCNTPPLRDFGWAAVDQMGRRFAGLPTHDVVTPLPFFNTANLTSTSPDSTSTYYPFNWVNYYTKLWGVK
jgi:ribose transport system substrate-binding protein